VGALHIREVGDWMLLYAVVLGHIVTARIITGLEYQCRTLGINIDSIFPVLPFIYIFTIRLPL
jgi:hypothetical protein